MYLGNKDIGRKMAMSETGITLNKMISELRQENPSVLVQFMHDLSHELSIEDLEEMLKHARETKGVKAEKSNETKVRMSSATSQADRRKVIADEVREIAQSIEDGDIELPEDLKEVTVDVSIEGKRK